MFNPPKFLTTLFLGAVSGLGFYSKKNTATAWLRGCSFSELSGRVAWHVCKCITSCLRPRRAKVSSTKRTGAT